jgi:hypothetical protein
MRWWVALPGVLEKVVALCWAFTFLSEKHCLVWGKGRIIFKSPIGSHMFYKTLYLSKASCE